MSGWAAAIQAGIQATAAAQQQYMDYRSQKRDMGFQREMSSRSMNFQREMASSGYQLAMADLKKAGLNPLLAYTQGPAKASGSSPAGSAKMKYSPMDLSSAYLMSAQADKLKAETENIRAQTVTEIQRPDLLRKQIQNVMSDTSLKDINWQIFEKKILEAQEQIKYLKAQTESVTSGRDLNRANEKLRNFEISLYKDLENLFGNSAKGAPGAMKEVMNLIRIYLMKGK